MGGNVEREIVRLRESTAAGDGGGGGGSCGDRVMGVVVGKVGGECLIVYLQHLTVYHIASSSRAPLPPTLPHPLRHLAVCEVSWFSLL